MPFKSKAQLRTCYGRRLSAKARGQKWNWDCDEWLQETPDPSCLPERKGSSSKSKCRPMRKDEKITSDIYRGARGGLYFYAGGVKVYVPRDAYNWVVRNYTVKVE